MSDGTATHKSRQYETKDSGHRQEFETGAVRDRQEGKGRFDLISVFAMQRLAGVYERGAAKYASRNWEKGMPLSRFLDSGLRHLLQLMEGKEDEDHAGQALWNIAGYIHIKEMIDRGILDEKLDDLPTYCPKDTDVDNPDWNTRRCWPGWWKDADGNEQPPSKEKE